MFKYMYKCGQSQCHSPDGVFIMNVNSVLFHFISALLASSIPSFFFDTISFCSPCSGAADTCGQHLWWLHLHQFSQACLRTKSRLMGVTCVRWSNYLQRLTFCVWSAVETLSVPVVVRKINQQKGGGAGFCEERTSLIFVMFISVRHLFVRLGCVCTLTVIINH